MRPTNKAGVLRKVPWSSLEVPEDACTRGKTDGWRSKRQARVRYWRKKGGQRRSRWSVMSAWAKWQYGQTTPPYPVGWR